MKAKQRGNPGDHVKVTRADLEDYLDRRAKVLGPVAVTAPSLPVAAPTSPPARKRPADLTEAEIRAELTRQQGRKQRTADALGIALNTLKSHMRKYGIE